jgi:2-keto-4-pentenoate hydratase/2-oxohepta-3-ene-1,7-dioic acid hydratase in catechol pathway/regulator of RNase E activity RraA
VCVGRNYRDHAAELGNDVPAAPMLFFKPNTSVVGPGDAVVLPPHSDFISFEGELAAVIGRIAKNVSAENALDYVFGYTIANDLTARDWQKSDGQWARAKGFDTSCPLGPAIETDFDVNGPAVITTRLNGEVRQQGPISDMIFSLADVIAFASAAFTLLPGDVILTGTPAGSSVVEPGDVVEVEVDVPDGPSTGRLITTVVEGADVAFDAAVGSLPAVDDTQRAEAWGSREAAGLVDGADPSTVPALSQELRSKLERTPVAGLSQQLRKRGLNNVTIDGVRPLTAGAKLVGTAKTLRFVPNREDLFTSHGGGYNAQKRAFDAVEEGEVLVIEARGETGSGTLGDVLAIRAHARGAAGIVTDGGVRDAEAVASVGIPVWSNGAHPAVLGRKHVPWDVDVTIGCGGTTVQPGDIVVGDSDGVIVIPPALAEEVADAALAQEEEDAWVAEQVAAGHPVDGLFPMNEEWKARYRAWREAK